MRILFAYIVFALLFFSACKPEEGRYFVVEKIQSSAKLASTETVIDKVVFGTKERKLLGLVRMNEAKFVAHTKAFVKTGIDLSKLTAEDVKIEGKRIEIMLPDVEVVNFSYPFESFRIDSNITESKFLNQLTIYDIEKFYQMAEIDIRNNLKYLGIRQASREKTSVLIRGLLENLGYREIYIQYKEGEFIPEINDKDIL